MKLFDIDWADFVRKAATWGRLSAKDRRAFLAIKGGEGAKASAFKDGGRAIAEAGFVLLEASGQRARPAPAAHEFSKAARAMARIDVLADPGEKTLRHYIKEHFDEEEQRGLLGDEGSYYGNDFLLADRVRSLEWVEDFLKEEPKPRPQRRGRDLGSRPLPSWLVPPGAKEPQKGRPRPPIAVAQDIVRRFMSWPDPVPFEGLPERFPDIPLETLGGALLVGIERLVLFPVMRMADRTPLVGLWPPVARRLQRPKAKPPVPVETETAFHGAFLMEDMTSILAAASGKPLRVRNNDGVLFAKVEEELAASLMPLPAEIDELAVSDSSRITMAIEWLEALDFAHIFVHGDRKPGIEPTPAGRVWLASGPKERLKHLLEWIRPGGRRKRLAPAVRPLGDADYADDYGDEGYGYGIREIGFAGTSLRFQGPEQPDLTKALIEAYGTLADGRPVRFTAFATWRAEELNPLLGLKGKLSVHSSSSIRRASVEELESLWGQVLTDFLRFRLLPLGGVRTAAPPGAGLCIALTDIGLYLLGLRDDFDYGRTADSEKQVVVQPNFEIVFLAPAPLAEAAIGRFAERKARRLGALFQITKKSILAAAGTGMTVQQVLQILQEASAKPLPGNVEREIRGWFDQVRHVTVRPALLVRCPDAETASRVIAAGGSQAAAVTDTVVELPAGNMSAEMVRKLRAVGVFIDR